MSASTVMPDELKAACQSGKPLDLIDVRSPIEFREVHLAGAHNVPLDRLDPVTIMQARQGAQDEPLYIICRTGSRGRKACELFHRAGFTNVVNVEGGTLACLESGFQVVRGAKSISLERQVRIAAGSLVLLGSILSWLVHPGFLALTAFIGAGLVFAGITDFCGMGLLLARMPWNRVVTTPSCTT